MRNLLHRLSVNMICFLLRTDSSGSKVKELTKADKKLEYAPADKHMGLVERRYDFYEAAILTVQMY